MGLARIQGPPSTMKTQAGLAKHLLATNSKCVGRVHVPLYFLRCLHTHVHRPKSHQAPMGGA